MKNFDYDDWMVAGFITFLVSGFLVILVVDFTIIRHEQPKAQKFCEERQAQTRKSKEFGWVCVLPDGQIMKANVE